MNLSEPFIKRPVMTLLVMLSFVLLGMNSYFRLPVSNLPNVDYPTIDVKANLPGASPETMANTVATPMETEFMTIPGIVNVTSNNTLGNTDIILQFDLSKSMDSAAQDVEAAISRASARLPPNLPNPPTYKKVNPSESPILYVALTSETMSLGDLYTYGYTFIGERLSAINGVAQVLVYGSPFAVRIQVDPGIIANRALTLKEMGTILARSTPNLPTGQLYGHSLAPIIEVDGMLTQARHYAPLVVQAQNGAILRIRDVGQALDSLQNDKIRLKYVDREKSLPCVVLAIQRQPGANTVQVADRVAAVLPQLTAQLPQSVELITVYDLSKTIRESIYEVKKTLIEALVLVVLVIFLYLGNLRDTIIPSIVMPVSIIVTFVFMDILGYSLDNLSLLALTLSTGFIVDDAIVVLENIVRRVENQESRWAASLLGSQQISFTILSMTLSLIAVFIPMLFMAGLIGRILREFSVTLVIVIAISGFISLTLTPMLCSLFVGETKDETQGVAGMAHRFNHWLLGHYSRSLRWVLQHRPLALGVGALSVILSTMLFFALPQDFIPDDDIGFITGFMQGAEGTPAHKTIEYERQVSQVLANNPAVETFVSVAGIPQQRQGLFFIRLKPPAERVNSNRLIQQLYGPLYQIPGIQIFLKNVPLINLNVGNNNNRGTYQYTLTSLDTEDLYAAAEELQQEMSKLEGFQAVSSDLEINNPQLNVTILRDKASSLGIDATQIEEALTLAYSGNRVAKIQTPLDQYDVILELLPEFQLKPSDLSTIYLRSSIDQQLVPLNAVTEWKMGVGPASVNHIQKFPGVTISFNLAPGYPLGTALDNLEKLVKKTVPGNVIGSPQGAAETFRETISSISFLLVVAVLAIYIVLGILYESFIHPLTILSSLPPAVLGGLLILWVLGYPLSLYGYLGILLLIGIVKKNGIMMVDYALDNIHHGESSEQSIYDAALIRFRPIMMTTIAAIMGALPIALGSGSGADARRPLGLVVIGGLLLSQVITLYLTPVIYLYLETWHERIRFPQEAETSPSKVPPQ